MLRISHQPSTVKLSTEETRLQPPQSNPLAHPLKQANNTHFTPISSRSPDSVKNTILFTFLCGISCISIIKDLTAQFIHENIKELQADSNNKNKQPYSSAFRRLSTGTLGLYKHIEDEHAELSKKIQSCLDETFHEFSDTTLQTAIDRSDNYTEAKGNSTFYVVKIDNACSLLKIADPRINRLIEACDNTEMDQITQKLREQCDRLMTLFAECQKKNIIGHDLLKYEPDTEKARAIQHFLVQLASLTQAEDHVTLKNPSLAAIDPSKRYGRRPEQFNERGLLAQRYTGMRPTN